jgi:5'-methylthioadenosine phosphorylase
VSTPFGKATVFVQPKADYVVVPRHGAAHATPPHGINYRANIAALEKLGVSEIIATSAVGSMNREFGVGEIGLADQFLDFTKMRQATFFEKEVVHTDMTHPYSERLNRVLLSSAEKSGLKVHPGLVYVCAEGPRFETAAEIRMYRALGGDVVGMTGVPEVVLANEKRLEYASVLIATNWAAGMQARVTQEEVLKVMKGMGREVKRLIDSTVGALRGEKY